MAIFSSDLMKRSTSVTENQQNDEDISTILPDVDISNVSDNIDEAVSDIILSSERNWSMLMQTVGIAELTAMEADGDVIYEAVDIKAFFGKIKAFFQNLLDKIAGVFKKIVETVQDWFAKIKRTFNDKKFKDLTSIPDGFKYEGYVFSDNITEPFKKDIRSCFNTTTFLSQVYKLEKILTDDNMIENHVKELNDPENKKTLINQIRSYLLDEKLDGDYDWNKEIFKHFRSGKEKPEEITAKDIDIAEYKTAINENQTSIKRSVKEGYKQLEKDANNYIETLKAANKIGKEAGLHDLATDGNPDLCVKEMQATIKYAQEYMNAATAVYTGQVKALADQAKQYYSALVKMLSTKPSENKTDNKDNNVTESFGFTHSLLDNVNFI